MKLYKSTIETAYTSPVNKMSSTASREGADKAIRTVVKRAMKANKMSVGDLASKSNINPYLIRRFLDGGGMSTRTLGPVAKTLKIKFELKAVNA